jgi:hypothetical protein
MPFGLKPVSSHEFGDRIAKVGFELKEVLDKGIVPFSIFGLLLSISLLIVASIFAHKMLKKVAIGGIGTVLGTVILYYSAPLWIGLALTIGKILGGEK